jgi:hypothetical protein
MAFRAALAGSLVASLTLGTNSAITEQVTAVHASLTVGKSADGLLYLVRLRSSDGFPSDFGPSRLRLILDSTAGRKSFIVPTTYREIQPCNRLTQTCAFEANPDFRALPAGFYRLKLSSSEASVTDTVEAQTLSPFTGAVSDGIPVYSPGSAKQIRSHSESLWAFSSADSYVVSEDASTTRFQQALRGRPLWFYGDYALRCIDNQNAVRFIAVNDHAAVRVRSVGRVTNLVSGMDLEGALPPYASDNHSVIDYIAVSPLIVEFEPQADTFRPALVIVNARRRLSNGTCIKVYGLFADEWDIRRALTISDPRFVHPEWPASLRAAMLQYQVKIGMTHEMVAFASGFPTSLEPVDRLLVSENWEWRSRSPDYAYRATFRDDQLVEVAPLTGTQ